MLYTNRSRNLALMTAIYALLSITCTASAQEACETKLARRLQDGRFFIDRATLAGTMAKRGYSVNPKALANFPQTSGGPSFDEVLASEVLGGAINNDKDSLTYYFGDQASRYAGMWFLVGRFNTAQRVREYYAVNMAVNRESEAMVIVDVRPAPQRSVQVYSAAVSSVGRELPSTVQSRHRIRPLLGCSNLDVPAYIVDKLEGRHEIAIAQVVEALNSQRRSNAMPYLDRGLVVPDQYNLYGFTTEGRKVRIGLKKEFKDGSPLWRLLTAFYKD